MTVTPYSEHLHIMLVTLQLETPEIMDTIRSRVRQVLQLPVFLKDCHLDPSPFFNADRHQYNADRLLGELATMCPHADSKVLAVTSIDLYTPILSYIFGQAYLGGHAGIVSGHRLHNERYGLPADPHIYQQRVTKSVIHELGHAFGLRHCLNPDCVMVASTYVEEVDMKGSELCDHCRSMLPIEGSK